ncbi:MAG TPA: S46 family peptidase, partial [Holophagaceae bacterium]
TSAEAARQVNSQIFGIENSLKATLGYRAGLLDKAAMARIEKAEKDLRAQVARNPKLATEAGQSWQRIQQAVERSRKSLKEAQVLDLRLSPIFGTAGDPTLLRQALTLVRLAEESAKPEAQRLPEYSQTALPQVKARLLLPAPYVPEKEAFLFERGLEDAQKLLGSDHPLIKALLGGKSPKEVARAAVEGSKLADPAIRKALIEGGKSTLDASTDPMILLARKVDPLARRFRQQQEAQVHAVIADQAARIARARFAVYGTSTYPDATFTLRLAYGAVEGYPANGTLIQPFTTFGGLFDRYDGWGGNAANAHQGAWSLPQRWVDHRRDLDLSMPLDFVNTADIIGGNSGSPVVDEKGELVGLIFDGNIESLPGNYFYDGRVNRAVAVDARALAEALRKVYGANTLADELTR